MGLDVLVVTDNYEQLPSDGRHFNQHSLSRTFCTFTLRENSIDNGGETELEQIGRLTGVDISPIEQLKTYPKEEYLEFRLGQVGSEAERQELLAQDAAAKAALVGNIPAVLHTLQQLQLQLATLPNLPALLNDHGRDLLGYNYYFTDFLTDKGEGYIGNNFGQDLRNFERFLRFAQQHGATTAWFSYG